MARRIWRIEPCAPTLTAQEQTQLGISPLVASMLARRGIQDMAAALRFLEGGLADLYSPSLLPEADKAAQRLKEAICKHEKILIYGDYDVDGITSTALILRVLRKLNVKDIMYFIPAAWKRVMVLTGPCWKRRLNMAAGLLSQWTAVFQGTPRRHILRITGLT